MEKNDEFSKREQEDKELMRQLEIRNLEKMIAEIPPEKRKEHKIIVGTRTFTLEELLAEAKEGTEYGNLFVSMQSKSRIERLRRK